MRGENGEVQWLVETVIESRLYVVGQIGVFF